MEKKKALAYKKFVKDADEVFCTIISQKELLDPKEIKKFKRKYQPEDFELVYEEFEDELRENCLNYDNYKYIKSFLRSIFQDAARWYEHSDEVAEGIINGDFEVEFLLKLHESIVNQIKNFNLFSQQPFDVNNDALYDYYSKLMFISEDNEMEDSHDTLDPRFDFVLLKSEMNKPEMTVPQKLKLIKERLFDFLQWQKQYDTIDIWSINSDESKYEITRKLYPKFEALCRLEIERWESLIGISAENKESEALENKKDKPYFKIASKHKTDVIKILSAMYDSKMFVDSGGKPVSNKQKLMDTFGEFLGKDFTSYSTLLSQAKDNDPDVFLRTFDELKKAGKKYLEKE